MAISKVCWHSNVSSLNLRMTLAPPSGKNSGKGSKATSSGWQTQGQTDRLPFWGNKEIVVFVRWTNRTGCHFWGTNRLLFLRDKQVALFEGQTSCPLWGTNGLPFLGDKQIAHFLGMNILPFWGTNRLPFVRDKQIALFEGQTDCPQ